MVSWLTCIMGSSGNSIRNLREICTGDHHSCSQLVTWAASCGRASLQLGPPGLLAGPLMRPPRPVNDAGRHWR